MKSGGTAFDFLQAAKGFAEAIASISIRGIFADGNQVMIAYDTLFPEPIGHFPTASLITFEDGLMKTLEFFYDPRPLLKAKKDQILISKICSFNDRSFQLSIRK